MDFYERLRARMKSIIDEHKLDQTEVAISSNALTAEEAIGITERQDFPLNKGKEVMLNAVFKDVSGQAFTDQPSVFNGSISQLMGLDLSQNNNRALLIAASNAILCQLGLIGGTVHCKNEGPESCAREISRHLQAHYSGAKIGLVGLQPSILDQLRSSFSVRVLDLNPDSIGRERQGIVVEDGEKDLEDVIEWADLLLVTGSTSVNGTIVNYIDIGKPVIFFGVTIAAIAYLLDLPRLCFSAS